MKIVMRGFAFVAAVVAVLMVIPFVGVAMKFATRLLIRWGDFVYSLFGL